jgi:flagellar basal-body rod protein FlgB
MSLLDTLQIGELERLLDVASFRQQLVVSNMANVDTPHYRTKDINFEQALAQAEAALAAPPTPAVEEVPGLIQRPDGNNVNMDRESMILAKTDLEFRVGAQLLRREFQRIRYAISEGGQPQP